MTLENQQIIADALEALNYKENKVARILATYEKYGYKFLVFTGNDNEEIEREDKHICSVNTDNYMGGVQATSLLAKSGAEILIHINADVSPNIPSYGRIQGFLDTCTEQNLPHELILTDTGHSYEESIRIFYGLLDEIEQKYKNKVKENHKRKPRTFLEPVHKVITPILLNRKTTK